MPITIFCRNEILARGNSGEFPNDVRLRAIMAQTGDVLAFDDETGRPIDLALAVDPAPRKRGRPSIGVEAKEVTLLPRHWQWLADQPGGASVTLRKLVEAASKAGRSVRECRDAACRFLTVMAGDMPGYEEAIRALYAGDRPSFDVQAAAWPPAIAAHACSLAWPEPAA
jgi:hypothetical protein